MDDGAIDREAMGKMAKALVFIKGPADPTALALKLASESGKPADIKKARALFIKLKPQRPQRRHGDDLGRLSPLPERHARA